ncbi:MAG: 50S ribosomal protein L7/L12 [Nitrospira sp.]
MSATQSKLSKEEFIAAIESMSVLELSELVKGLETRFGVTAAAPVAVAAAPAAGGGAAAAAEEKTSFDVVLASAPADKKIQIIKVVRELTNLGLKEAKDLVEGAPKPVKTGVAKEEADTMKKKLEESGAKVEIK